VARQWTCRSCRKVNKPNARLCACGERCEGVAAVEPRDTKGCSRCGARKPIDEFFFVSRARNVRRGTCKDCDRELRSLQKNPDWKPKCHRCGKERPRVSSGRRLCEPCFDEIYDMEDRPRAKLTPCSSCGAKRLRADTTAGTRLCPICRSVSVSRRRQLSQSYNMTPREYLAMLEDQSYRCWICHTKPRKTLHIDHSHSEPRLIRGLVCARCNTMLGMARDNPDLLRGAAKYLEAPPAQFLFPGREAHEIANRRGEPWRVLRRAA
jgi:hypothetical protein